MTMTKATDISIQFYATLPELIDFVQEILDDQVAYATVIVQTPFQLKSIISGDVESILDSSVPHRIYFTLEKPLQCSSKTTFEANISNPLILDLGHLNSIGLHQSWLACRVTDEKVIRIWHKVARMLKQITSEGVTATNRTNGISHYYKSFRHTLGARTLQEKGVAMIPPQGEKGPLMRLGQ
jgi:hypothetical protein